MILCLDYVYAMAHPSMVFTNSNSLLGHVLKKSENAKATPSLVDEWDKHMEAFWKGMFNYHNDNRLVRMILSIDSIMVFDMLYHLIFFVL